MVNDFFLTTWFLQGMKWVYSNVNSVFLTILICTVVLKAVTLFSDIKTRRSSADMQRIQPQLQRIQKKYEKDPQKAQLEQRKLMKKEGVSMWSSCLPMLITMPLFFCFIAAFRFWSYEEVIKLLVSDNPTELFATFKFLWVNNIWQADNGLFPVIEEASKFLATKNLGNLIFLRDNPDVWEKLVQLGIAAKQAVVSGDVTTYTYAFLNTDAAVAAYNTALQGCVDMYAGHNNGWFIFSIITCGLNFLSTWQMQRRQPEQQGQAGNTNKMMMYMMPIMSFVICLTSTTAFALYWTFNSLMMIVTNFILDKAMPRAKLPSGEGENAK
jgi:YidC/Oxa1 family membrane protein insertase